MIPKPEGISVLERPVGSFFAWFGRVNALNPQLWGDGMPAPDGEETPREQALRREIARLREQFSERLALERDLRSLKTVFDELRKDGLDRRPRVLGARVLRTNDAAAYRQSILIDRGAEDGLEPGLAVVSGWVFVGRVEIVHPRSSLVKLVTDRRSHLEIALRTTSGARLRGYVRGNGRGTDGGDLDVRLVVVPDDAGRIPLESAVLTSNADPRVPPQLLVGYVSQVRDQDLDGMPVIRLRPAVDLGRSTRVLVLMPD